MIDTDIEGLGPKEASDYVLAFITTLKRTEKALAASEEEVALWTRRAALARSKGDDALAAQGEQRLTEAAEKRAALEAELADLKAKVAVLKDKLVRLRMTGGRLVDTDLLLAQLEMVVGKKDDLSRVMKEEESKAALDELKKKMGQQGEPQ
jgi:phage shock protein A